MKFRFLALAMFLSVATISCKDTTTANDEDVETTEDQTTNTMDQMKSAQPPLDSAHIAEVSQGVDGTFKGTLPCEDCEGIEAEITLEKRKRWRSKMDFKGTGKVIEEKGVWSMDGDKLTLKGGELTPSNFRVEENQIRQLDDNGNEITGAATDNYILKK